MDVFEYAMQMEKDGEHYYRRIAEQVANKGLKTILTMLADEEVRHYNIVREIRSGRAEMVETTILDDAKNVFVRMEDSGEGIDFDVGQIELYKKAQVIEEQSRGFYLEKSGEVEEEYQREIFLKLAEEENKHYFLLDNIIEFVLKPERWLENAEFCHLEEY